MTSADTFLAYRGVIDAPATSALAITKSDATTFSTLPRYVYVGTTGDLAVLMQDDTVSVILKAVPAGATLRIRPQKVLATGTTASDIVLLF
jgi:hypothetical protein